MFPGSQGCSLPFDFPHIQGFTVWLPWWDWVCGARGTRLVDDVESNERLAEDAVTRGERGAGPFRRCPSAYTVLVASGIACSYQYLYTMYER